MKLYEVGAEIVTLLEQLEEMGADEQQIKDTLEATGLGDDFDEKASQVAAYIKNLKADAEAYKAEKQRLAELEANAKKKAESVTNYLDYWMKLAGRDKVKHGVHEIKYRKGSEVVEIDEMKLPSDPIYWIPQSPKPLSKTEFKKLIKEEGLSIPGVSLVRKPDSVVIK